jgi:DNA polymerase-3 subunit delta'
MSFQAIEGQDSAVRLLEHALRAGRIGQAYLFVGPSGVGKQKTALALARAALCETSPGIGCDACEICRRVDEGKHPDARVFEPRDEGNRNLQVEQLRNEILPLAKFAPFEGKAAFLIFPQADVSFPVQHPEAANALLKTLEEPRANVHFVLLSERPERLLPTIRSRCQRVRFSRLPKAVIARVLERSGATQEAREAALALAAGRADRALALCANDRAEHIAQWTLRIDEALAQRNPGVLLDLASELASSEDRALVLEALQTFYRDVAARALGAAPSELAFGARLELLDARGEELRAGRAAARVAVLQQIGEDIESTNANPEIALDGALFALAASA